MKKKYFAIITKTDETGEVPKDYEKYVMIFIPKKKNAEKREECRTISLISCFENSNRNST